MDLVTAVKKTVAYASFFNYPLSPQEVYYWLISSKTTPLSQVKKIVSPLNGKDTLLKKNLHYNAKQKELIAHKFVKIAQHIPTIKLIALTGSVAANNCKRNDDIDLMIVTSAHTLWITRPLVLLILNSRFSRRHPGDATSRSTRNSFCPNLWLDTQTLQVPKSRQNIYTAHEVLQVKPLYEKSNSYQKFIKSNHWTKQYLANAYTSISRKKRVVNTKEKYNWMFAPLNFMMFVPQLVYMLPKITSEKISLHSAYFHKIDPSGSLIKQIKD